MSDLALLTDFIESCAFLHDDWNPSIGFSDWDSYDTNPLLLGASVCVVGTLKGFGDGYLEYLNKIGCLSRDILIPKTNSDGFQTVVERLANDPRTLSHLKDLIASQDLDLSVFYRYNEGSLTEIRNALFSGNGTFRIHPEKQSFITADDRITCWRKLRLANLPLPMSTICSNDSEVDNFARHACSKGFSQIILKQGHRNSVVLESKDVGANYQSSLTYPLIAEAVYDVLISPVSQAIRWKGKTGYLFTLAQKIEKFHFRGNTTLPRKWRSLEPKCIRLLQKVHALFPEHTGVFGVDFILTKENELLIVDVNPRFNSSTYPLYFLQRRLKAKQKRIGNFRIVESTKAKNLFELHQHLVQLAYDPNAHKGILLFNPVLNKEKTSLQKWSFLLISENLEEEERQIKHVKQLIEDFQ